MKFDFDDILIVPKENTSILSRNEIYSRINGYLPLITAPMDMVINEENENTYRNLGVIPCLPRNMFSENLSTFESYSISQISNSFNESYLNPNGSYLIDVANGHMDIIVELVMKISTTYPNLKLMVGNIANPETYRILSNAGAKYVRVGIGMGSGCLTAKNTGIGYPMASLISECYAISCELSNPAYIVADGGMKDYSDIIKALALGADFVMIGGIFNKALESAGHNYIFKKIRVSKKISEIAFNCGLTIHKKFRGMSTKEVQKEWGNKILKTSEGVIRFNKVEYKLDTWVENFESYLRSTMSYCNSRNLSEFIGKQKIIGITNNSYKRFDK